MKQLIGQVNIKINKNKKWLWFFAGLSLIGIVSGTLFLVFISKTDQLLVKSYISDFINLIKDNNLNYFDAFRNSFLSLALYVIIVWLLGMSVIGIPIIMFLYFVKNFTLGFSIAVFILNYKFKGIIFAILYSIPSLINIFLFVILMIFSVKFSISLIDLLFKHKNSNFKIIVNKYITMLAVSIAVIFISSLIETFLVPFIIHKLLFIL